MNNTFAGILGGVFFIALAGLLAGHSLVFRRARFCRWLVWRLALPSCRFIFRSGHPPEFSEDLKRPKKMAKTATRLAIIEAAPPSCGVPHPTALWILGMIAFVAVAIFAAELGAKLALLT